MNNQTEEEKAEYPDIQVCPRHQNPWIRKYDVGGKAVYRHRGCSCAHVVQTGPNGYKVEYEPGGLEAANG